MTTSTETAITTSGLTRRFRRHVAVDSLDLQVPAGSVFAFLGRNGAGKTTTIRMLLDLLGASSGRAWIAGMDCVRDAQKIRQRVGYVSEGQKLWDWMTVDKTIWFCKGFYRTWDEQWTRTLKRRLELDGDRKVRDLSRGTRARLSLLLALAFRPDVLILDEPTAGLDAVVRREFLESVIELMMEEGRTVFFSTHQVTEVERVADRVGIIDHGRLMRNCPVDELKAQVKRLALRFDQPPAGPIGLPGTLDVTATGREAVVTVKNFGEEILAAARALGAREIRVEDLGLEDIFVSLVGREG